MSNGFIKYVTTHSSGPFVGGNGSGGTVRETDAMRIKVLEAKVDELQEDAAAVRESVAEVKRGVLAFVKKLGELQAAIECEQSNSVALLGMIEQLRHELFDDDETAH